MQLYFLAERECILTLGGAVVGIADSFERSVELDPADEVLCTLTPFGGYLPVSFRIDEDLLLSPPPQVTVYHMGAGRAALYIGGFLRSDQSLKVLWQREVGGALLTLLRQGRLFLDIRTAEGVFLTELPDALETCSPEAQDGGFLLTAADAFALLSPQGEVLVETEGRVTQAGETVRAEVPFHDCCGHTALCEWRQGTLLSCTLRSARGPTPATFALALFESVLIGLDPAPFLSPELDAAALKEYLGSFVSVVLADREDCVGLVYPRRERVFDVRYFTVETDGQRVCNIVPAP